MRDPKSGNLSIEILKERGTVLARPVEKPKQMYERFRDSQDVMDAREVWESLPENAVFEVSVDTRNRSYDPKLLFVNAHYKGQLMIHSVYNSRFDLVHKTDKTLQDFM
jgi:hypothetical protein